MIPLRDVIPSRTTPVVTMGLIVVSALAFLLELWLSPATRQGFLRDFGIVSADFRPATLVSSIFLHASWLQLLANMWYLWIFGDNVEDRMGHGRYLLFYLFAGAAAGLAQAAANAGSYIPTVGAGGSVSGVIGAYFVLYPRSRVLTLVPIFVVIQLVEIPALWFLGFWFLVQLLGGVGSVAHTTASQGGMALWAQLAGFAWGLGGVFLFRRPERSRVEWWSE